MAFKSYLRLDWRLTAGCLFQGSLGQPTRNPGPLMFVLSKWYCDCVSDEGIAFVGYWARMRWGLLNVPYVATLYKPPAHTTRERCSIRRCAAPAIEGDALHWDCRRLGIHGVWTARAPGISRVLLETAEGSITWRCHFPCAEARIDLDGIGQVSGLGYAEQLVLSLKPWRLPFERLRWGRFLSLNDAVTWIEWSGREPRQWVFHNGVELHGVASGTERVELGGDRGVVELRDAVVVREGRLASTALRAIPGARLWLPRGVRNAHETKWLARGTFATSGRSSSGWVIHEIVCLR